MMAMITMAIPAAISSANIMACCSSSSGVSGFFICPFGSGFDRCKLGRIELLRLLVFIVTLANTGQSEMLENHVQ